MRGNHRIRHCHQLMNRIFRSPEINKLISYAGEATLRNGQSEAKESDRKHRSVSGKEFGQAFCFAHGILCFCVASETTQAISNTAPPPEPAQWRNR
jgi:hypothetical protein